MRRYIKDQKGLADVTAVTTEDGMSKTRGNDDVRDLQANHSSHFAGMHYARDAADMFSDVTWNMREKFRAVSIE